MQASIESIAEEATPRVIAASDLSVCSACAVLEGANQSYLAHVLIDPVREELHAQAIADSFGFCIRHAAQVAGCEDPCAVIGRVLRRAIELTLELIEPRRVGSEFIRDILFQSANACPACTYSARQLTRSLTRAGRRRNNGAGTAAALCFAHYRDAIGLADAARLVALAKEQLRRMKTEIGSSVHRNVSSLGVLAGNRALLPAVPLGCELLMPQDEQPQSWNVREACPVCIGMARDLHKRFGFAKWALRIGVDSWIVLPTCPEHLWLFARLAGDRAAERATEESMATIVSMLQSGITAVMRGRRQRETESTSVWYKPKSPSVLLGVERAIVTRAPRCPICGGLAVAREREVGSVLEQLKKRQAIRDLEQGYGLCMKHFASVFLFAPAGAMRDALVAAQREKLSALYRELSDSPLSAYKDAIYRLSGWM